jgi:hypothetical protein
MKGEKREPAGDIAVIKIYIWFMVGFTVLFAGGLWYLRQDVQESRKSYDAASAKLDDLAVSKSEILSMLKVYRDNDEDLARTNSFTWFSNAWRRTGIPDNSIDMGSWDDPPRFDNKGKFFEETIKIGIESRNPLTRKQIVEFAHEVERASTRLRIIELDLKRANRKEGLEKDEWSGRLTIGYRRARINE